MTGYRSSLASYAPSMRDPDPAGARKRAAKAWHDDGTIILLPESISRLDWQDRELVRAVAAKIYGKREGK